MVKKKLSTDVHKEDVGERFKVECQHWNLQMKFGNKIQN
jgi:hypothetical protein